MNRVSCTMTLVFVLAAGCGGRTVGGPIQNDGGTSDPDGVAPRPDGGQPDGGPVVCEEQRHMMLKEVPLDQLAPYHWEPLTEGRTLRFVAGLSYGGCDEYAGVGWWMENNGRTVYVAGRIWQAQGVNLVCPGFEVYAQDIIVVPGLPAGTVEVREAGSDPGALRFTIDVLPCDNTQDCFCQGGGGQKQTGEECAFDCECQYPFLCLTHYGMAGEFAVCGQNCSRDAECPGGRRCDFTDDGFDGVCNAWPPPDECADNNDCPAGYACTAGDLGNLYCRAAFNPMGGANCECDAQCPVGQRCTDLGIGEVQSCAAHCLGERDCPQGFFCRGDMYDEPPVCGVIDP